MPNPKKPETSDRSADNNEVSGDSNSRIILPTRQDIAETTEADATATEIRKLNPTEQDKLLAFIERRLSQTPAHYSRPNGINFADVRRALEADPSAMWSLFKMEMAGGQPDIISVEEDYFIFADCSLESPEGHLNCVYDREVQRSLTGKKAKQCIGNAVDMAKEAGVNLMDEYTYAVIFQILGMFDQRTYNLLLTQPSDRKANRIIAADRGPTTVRLYHFTANDSGPDPRGGWRGVKRVRKVA